MANMRWHDISNPWHFSLAASQGRHLATPQAGLDCEESESPHESRDYAQQDAPAVPGEDGTALAMRHFTGNWTCLRTRLIFNEDSFRRINRRFRANPLDNLETAL